MLKQSRFLTAFQQDRNPLIQLNQDNIGQHFFNGHISLFSRRCGISRIYGKQIVSCELFAVSIANDVNSNLFSN